VQVGAHDGWWLTSVGSLSFRLKRSASLDRGGNGPPALLAAVAVDCGIPVAGFNSFVGCDE